MAIEIRLPRLGWTMEEGTFVEWLKQDGDLIKPGDLLFTIEGDKATSEVEAFDNGILRIPPDGPTPGAILLVGSVLGYLVQPGERPPFEGQPAPSAPALVEPPQPPMNQIHAQPAAARNGQKEPTISPRARRVARELGVAWGTLTGSGRTGRIVERDIRALAAQASSGQIRATPLARRMAKELGVDLEQLAAHRPGQRIERSAVEQAAQAQSPAGVAASVSQPAPMRGVRRIIAARMAESAHTAATVTLTTDADATELVLLRQRILADSAGTEQVLPTYTDLFVRLVALALIEHPELNASLIEDQIVQHAAVHVGIAVDTDRGLLVPVVRDAHTKSVQQIATVSAEQIARVRSGKAEASDLRGGTFTITNLGMYEIDAFTPLINLPECAILGIGRIVARPIVIDEQAETIAVRKMVALSLSFDHRIVDGAPAARFLKRIKYLVERPYAWLIR